jgi:hypothetical protein
MDLKQSKAGRPRKYPQGTTATQRVAISTAALKASGGARKTFRLSPEACQALQSLVKSSDSPTTETEIIERLLVLE